MPNVREVAKCCVFSMIRVSGQSKSRPVKAAGAESCGQRRKQKLHAAVAKSTLWSENVQNTSVSDHFMKFRCPKMYAAVAKSTFGSENVKKLTIRDRFLKFRCPKIVRRCGEKHIWKWKCLKTDDPGPFFEVQMLKNSTRLWRKAHSEVKMYKTPHSGSTFWGSAVEKLHAAVAKSTLWSQNVQNTPVFKHFSNIWCAKIARPCGEKRFLKSKCTKHVSSGQFFEVLMSKN